MERYYDVEGNEVRYPRRRRQSNAPAWTMAIAMIAAVVAFGLWLAPDFAFAPSGAVGNQAPPSAVRRAPTISAPAQFAPIPTSIPGLAGNEATAQAQYDAAVAGGEHVEATPTLPLNSAGKPVIGAAQQAQQQLSLQLAEQEGAAAADAQLAAQRATADAAALARPPDVSYEDAAAMLHRDPCHVPRANPATCAQGLYKPTPVN